MRISEFIAKLNEIQESEGDLELRIFDSDTSCLNSNFDFYSDFDLNHNKIIAIEHY